MFFTMTQAFFHRVASAEAAAAASNEKDALRFPSFELDADAVNQDNKEFYAF